MKLNLSPLEWFMTILIGVVGYGTIMSGVWWLWCYVWSSLWPDGPETLIDPPLLPFVAGMVLVVWLKSFLGVKK